MCRAGAGIERTFGKCDTLGFQLVKTDVVGYDYRGYWKVDLERVDDRLMQSSLFLILSTRSNGDVSILLYEHSPLKPNPSELKRVVGYIIDYASKSNKTERDTRIKLKNLITEIKDDTQIRDEVRSVAIKYMNQIVKDKLVSKQEVMCLAGGLPLFICSESIDSVSIVPNARIKQNEELKYNSILNSYSSRTDNPNNTVSFYQYVTLRKNHQIQTTKERQSYRIMWD